MTPEEILSGAADLIEAKGWCQGMAVDEVGGVCMGRAIFDAAGMHERVWVWDASVPIQQAIDAVAQEIGDSPAPWNDAPGRTKEEVVTALRNSKRWL